MLNKSEFAEYSNYNGERELIVGNEKNTKAPKQEKKSNNEEYFISNEGFKVSFYKDRHTNEVLAKIIKNNKIYKDLEVRFTGGWTMDDFLSISNGNKKNKLFLLFNGVDPENSYVYIGEKLNGGCHDTVCDLLIGLGICVVCSITGALCAVTNGCGGLLKLCCSCDVGTPLIERRDRTEVVYHPSGQGYTYKTTSTLETVYR